MIRTPDGEPSTGAWHRATLDEVVRALALPQVTDRPAVIAVDGRSASGKSTLGARLAESLDDSCLVHTDDVAWWESFFGWDRLMADGILAPARRGEAVEFRPPAWEARNRDGAIVVPAGARVVIVEGVGASRQSLSALVDASIWVQSGFAEANRRGIARDVELGRTQGEADAFWDEWTAQEVPFLAEDRPWERASVIVCGTPALVGVAYDAETEVLVAD